MNLMELLDILKKGEGPHVEFKSDFTKQSHDIAKELAAFANSGGGVLLMGVDDNGTPKGVPNPTKVVERLAGIARSCSPPLLPEIDKVQLAEAAFIVYVKIPPSPPCLYQGKFFVRVGSCSMEASGGEELRGLLKYAGSGGSSFPLIPPGLFSPPPVRSLKGRADEVESLRSLLSNSTISVVIIEGISGIGKTALSANFANTIGEIGYIPFWIDCREDTTFDFINSALSSFARNHSNELLADSLEDVTRSIEERIARIATGLAECKYLLFFDDFHLVRDSLVDRMLQRIAERAIQDKVFLIARRRPRLATTISPLILAEKTIHSGLDIASCEQFLIDCGVTVSAEVANRIWRLTGEGHPKALEIFIARSRSYPITELLSSLPVFKEELRNKWIAPLMDELPLDQKDIAIDLSIFDRPVSFHTMNSLFPREALNGLLIGLVDNFILDRFGDDCFRMHPLIREYCYSLIQDKVARHIWAAEYYLGQISAEGNSDLITDTEISAGIAAWSHFIRAEDHVRATDALNILRTPLMNRGHYEELMFLIEQTRISPENEDWYRIHKARILSLWGHFGEAVSLVTSLISSEQEIISREAVLVLANILNDHGKPQEARELLEKHREVILTKAHTLLRRRYLSRLVEAYSLSGDLDQALVWASKIAETCDTEGDEISGAIALRQMAYVLLNQKKNDTALSLAQISHSLLKKHNRLRDAAVSARLMAYVYAELGNQESALSCLEECLQAFVNMGDRKNGTICRQKIKELKDKFHGFEL